MRFSVITVTFGNLAGLQRTAGSVLVQSSRDFEWIIVDGGSIDGTHEFLKTLQHPDTRWISEKDNGIFDAMNKGIAMSTGHYCIFLNAGDLFFDANVLAQVSSLIGIQTPPIVYGDTLEFGNNSLMLKHARRPFWNFYSMFTHHQSIFYSRDAVADGYDITYRFSADWALTTKLLKGKVGTAMRYAAPVAIFERGGVSQRGDYRSIIDREHWRILRSEAKISLPVAGLLWLLKTRINLLRSTMPRLYDVMRFKAYR
jgi:putative colanic acid biosynthesis glycosyltransferase